MRTTRGHEPILKVLAAAGVEPLRLPMGSDSKSLRLTSEEDEERRIEARQRSLEILRERKGRRRRLGVSGEIQALFEDEREKVEVSVGEVRDDVSLLVGGIAAVPRQRRYKGGEKQGRSWDKVVTSAGTLVEGQRRRGMERRDVIVDQYAPGGNWF
jgi:hypothetical protein